MTQQQWRPQQFVQAARRTAVAVRGSLFWFAGRPAEALQGHRADVQMCYTAAGLLVVAWYAFMLVTWMKTGAHFFGTGGALVFALVPTIILAIDRMILGRPRNPAGSLAAYAVDGLQPKRWEIAVRLGAALVFSAVTTFVFLVSNATADIRARQHSDQAAANAPVRKELEQQVEAKAAERRRTVDRRIAELEANAALLSDDLASARKLADETEAQTRRANFNLAAERGGIEGRALGEGPRFRAFEQLASQGRDDAMNARARESRAREALGKVHAELLALGLQREQAAAEHTAGLRSVGEELQLDARYVPVKRGMFADAGTLIRLYGDKELGPGLVLASILATALLFVLEMAPLLGAAFLPTTPADVERIALDRSDAAEIVGQQEVDLLRAQSRRTVRVRPVAPRDQAASRTDADDVSGVSQ